MSISTTELKLNPDESKQDRVELAKSLFGILPADITLEEAKQERLNQI